MPEEQSPAVVTIPNAAAKAIASQLGDSSAKRKADKDRLIYLVSSLKGRKAQVDPELQTEEDVQEYVQEKAQQEKEDSRAGNYKIPLLAAGLIAGGYGAKKLGDAALSKEDRNAVERLIDINLKMGQTAPSSTITQSTLNMFVPNKVLAPEYQGTKDLFYDYIDAASRASRVKPFGKPVVPMIKQIKSLFGLNHEPDPTDLFATEDANHYPAFEKGPIAAYLHQLKKVPLEPYAKNDNYADKLPKVKNFLFPYEDPKNRPDPLTVYKQIEDKLKEYIAKQPGNKTFEDAQDLTKTKHGDQMDIIRGLRGYITEKDPGLASRLDVQERQLADAQQWAGSMYAGGSNVALKLLQDFPRALGYTAAGAGLGLAGYWLYLKRKAAMREEEAKKKKTSKKTQAEE